MKNMEICLKPIVEDNFIDAFNLRLEEGQERFVSHPVRSLAQAYVYRNQCQPFGDSNRVALTCHRENAAALHIYRSFGFEPTGVMDDDEVEMALYR